MKLKVQDSSYTMPKILMKTSTRARMFSISFEKQDGVCKYWGHLNLRQAKLLVKEIARYISLEEYNKLRDNVVSKALSKIRKEKSNA